LLAADSIVTAWCWVAWINYFCSRWVCWLGVTGREGVANVSRVTLADGVVVIYGAGGVGTAHTRTWVSALVVDACLVGGAVWIDCALVFAFNIGISLKTRQTDTCSCLVPFSTLCIDSTGRWVAWINDLWSNGSSWWPSTLTEGISYVALVTDADWHMVSHVTIGVDTTEAGAWVLALASDASLVRGAVRVNDTLWSTVGWGADHIWEARTLAALTNYPRWVAVWTTWIRIAWVNIFNNRFRWWETACGEGIPNVISQTYTVGNVVDHLALGIYATVCLRTWVCTVQVYAGQSRWTFGIGGTLWSARNVGIPKVIWDTLACCCTSPCVADSIAATWRGVAGIHRLWNPWRRSCDPAA